MTMLRVLLQGPGCISKYGRCGCAKKNKNKKKKKQKIGMVDDKCWVSCFRVKGAFPNMESLALQK
jgi:hypothetical protein